MAALGDAAASGDAVGPFDTVASADQSKAFVAARLAEGSDYLKVVVDDGADLPALAPDVVSALVEAGHAAGLTVIVHALTAAEVEIALDAGVDGLAHVWVDAGPRTGELAGRVAAQGVFVVSTLVYFEVISQQGGADHALPGNERGAPGLRADLLLVDGDPTDDITATGAITDVWRRGVRQAR